MSSKRIRTSYHHEPSSPMFSYPVFSFFFSNSLASPPSVLEIPLKLEKPNPVQKPSSRVLELRYPWRIGPRRISSMSAR